MGFYDPIVNHPTRHDGVFGGYGLTMLVMHFGQSSHQIALTWQLLYIGFEYSHELCRTCIRIHLYK